MRSSNCHQCGSHPFSPSNSRRNSIQSRHNKNEMKGSANEQWTNFQSDMNKIRDAASKNSRRKSRDPKYNSKSEGEGNIWCSQKSTQDWTRNIVVIVKSCGPEVSSKQMRRTHACNRARIQRQCSKGWAHCKSRQRRQEWHRNTEPEKIQKLDGANYEIDKTRIKRGCSKS